MLILTQKTFIEARNGRFMDTDDYIQFVFVLIILLSSIICIILVLIVVKCVQICVHNRILCCKRARRPTRQSNSGASGFDCFSNELSSDCSNSDFEENDFSSSNSEILNYISNNQANYFDNLAYSVDSGQCKKINRKFNDPSRFLGPNKPEDNQNNITDIVLNPTNLCSYLDGSSSADKNLRCILNQQGDVNLCLESEIKEWNKEKIDYENDEIPPSYDQFNNKLVSRNLNYMYYLGLFYII
ncbi:hypothetical protein BpHYR1_021860 [Brachionus plicatilis]|uniref:Uncharacterized protein n=1 Tax=Brachionus plicatilis TaxID=10195 RepID=A0A3M7T4C7_BRAPC|nr:hypothetical protein BpHYR1_021860 [Brachionus plicatilis]